MAAVCFILEKGAEVFVAAVMLGPRRGVGSIRWELLVSGPSRRGERACMVHALACSVVISTEGIDHWSVSVSQFILVSWHIQVDLIRDTITYLWLGHRFFSCRTAPDVSRHAFPHGSNRSRCGGRRGDQSEPCTFLDCIVHRLLSQGELG